MAKTDTFVNLGVKSLGGEKCLWFIGKPTDVGCEVDTVFCKGSITTFLLSTTPYYKYEVVYSNRKVGDKWYRNIWNVKDVDGNELYDFKKSKSKSC